MDAKERHEQASVEAAREGCVCMGPKPDSLCIQQHPHGGLSCTRKAGHKGVHVACAGQLGPHAISSWARVSELAEVAEVEDPPR